jgi:hypothetical protein
MMYRARRVGAALNKFVIDEGRPCRHREKELKHRLRKNISTQQSKEYS